MILGLFQRFGAIALVVLVVLVGRRLVPSGMGVVPRFILLIILVIGTLTAVSWVMKRLAARPRR